MTSFSPSVRRERVDRLQGTWRYDTPCRAPALDAGLSLAAARWQVWRLFHDATNWTGSPVAGRRWIPKGSLGASGMTREERARSARALRPSWWLGSLRRAQLRSITTRAT